MVQNQAGIVVDNHFRKQRIEGETAGVVDDFSSMLNRESRHFRLVRIDGDGNSEFALQALQHRNQTAKLFSGGHARASGFGGFSADIQNVRALFFQFQRASERAIEVVIHAVTGERVRSYI